MRHCIEMRSVSVKATERGESGAEWIFSSRFGDLAELEKKESGRGRGSAKRFSPTVATAGGRNLFGARSKVGGRSESQRCSRSSVAQA